MRIDSVTMPDIQGKSAPEAIKILYEHCRETTVRFMHLNNKVEDLERKLGELESRQGFG